MNPVLDVRSLTVEFKTRWGSLRAVDGLSFSMHAGETLALVGESGCGKSTAALALMGLSTSAHSQITGEGVWLGGENLLAASAHRMRALRGTELAMVFQDPSMYLNPVYSVGYQIEEVLYEHGVVHQAQAHHRAVELLQLVGVPAPQERVHQFPHNLSGGMRQRVMIAMALACNPKVLIADEPTTALDVTIQAQVLELLKSLRQQLGMSILLITHDLGVVNETADRVVVMYAGKKVEEGTVAEVFAHPAHPYTQGLIQAAKWTEQDDGAFFEIPGTVPSLQELPKGCRFAQRCPSRTSVCEILEPVNRPIGQGRSVACHLLGATP